MSPIDNLASSESAAIAKSVRDLLLRKGIPKRSQCKKLKEILALSLSQAHRKMNGSSNWELAQIRQVADYFDEPFDSLNTIFSAPTPSTEAILTPAKFFIESRELPCLVSIGAPLHTTRNVDYVASQSEGGEWKVVESALAHHDVTYYKVKKLELSLKQARQLTIAVLDDNEVSADNLCDFLLETGFHAEAFYDIDTLEQEMAEKPFDGYVIDWFVGEKTAESLIQLIRTKKGQLTPILLLTGEIITGRAREIEVARIIMEYNVLLQEKPTRLPIIAAELSKVLGVA